MDISLTEAEKIRILNSDDLYGIMQRILLREQKIDRNRIHYWVVGLESNNRLLFIELISMGSVTQGIAEPVEVYSFALQKRAVKVIIVHNSPSGDLSATEADKDLTDQLIQAGRIVKLDLLDHLIISEKSYLSFEDTHLMAVLRVSTKWVPDYEMKERLRQEITKKVERRRNLAIARVLKMQGDSAEKIAQATGLSVEEVEKMKLKQKGEETGGEFEGEG